MTATLEISDELKERLDAHCEEGQTCEELIEELVAISVVGNVGDIIQFEG